MLYCKIAKHTLKFLRCSQRKFLKVYLAIFATLCMKGLIIIITAKLSILDNCYSPGYNSDLRAAPYEILFWSKVKITSLHDCSK